jgi:hypothetical protein
MCDTESNEYLRQALNVINEFVQDVENYGLERIQNEWPEMFITYCHAVEILS